ncbi:MAG TPA: response regulator, partial [Acidobacteriota bacterium]|nr:response regulator [Acidobacteriota bacterium]
LMMVTTESELSQMVSVLNAGADEYVMKPFTREIIFEKLCLLNLSDSGKNPTN